MKYCDKCSQLVLGAPIIVVEDTPYCYRCAKIVLPQLEQSRKAEASEQYKRRVTLYNAKKAAFEVAQSQWNQDQTEATKSNFWSDIACFAFAVVGALVGTAGGVQGFIAGGIIGFVFAIALHAHEHERLILNFKRRNPEPRFTLPEPDYPADKPVVVLCAPCPPDDKANDREAILKRDGYTCQSCGQRNKKEKLEVHHVIPRSQKGANTACNLITLCLKCHDREDWFGHVRAYPTTLPKKKPLPARIRRYLFRHKYVV